jgi:hypothetical protein
MGIGVKVTEYSGATVAELRGTHDVRRLCAIAAADPARYPLLAGVDEYDDTYFNARQTARLIIELKTLADHTVEQSVKETALALLELNAQLESAPGRPQHRQFIFVGD